jgi:hypothetical protein
VVTDPVVQRVKRLGSRRSGRHDVIREIRD